ncbi:MAG: cysteine methyltransferase [Alphaproteobacteria bacterium]|nr:MAG: cysteine methyltransferase [Alphaproteobacteria bacterium]
MPWNNLSVYEKVYALTCLVPPGRVATYGQIADYLAGVTPRMVGYALFALPDGTDVPWQRVINARGEISPRPGETGGGPQRALLEAEGVIFDSHGRVDLGRFRWAGPDPAWLAERGLLF